MDSDSAILDKYLSRIERVATASDNICCTALAYSKEIIIFFTQQQKPQNFQHITYSRLKDIAKANENHSFKITIGYLIHEDVNLLQEKFEAHNINNDESLILSFDEITDMMISREYINPFTEETISEYEFSEMITTFFALSQDFVGDLHAG